MSLEQTYRLIKTCIPETQQIDSLAVVKQVEQYRQLWKPLVQTNVILLAESHVYTSDQDYEVECNRQLQSNFIKGYPTHYVRFVYCLGKGENELLELLNKKVDKNGGRAQFWKIFSSCVAKDDSDLGFQRILKEKPNFTKDLEIR
jgi:hypothetical protein